MNHSQVKTSTDLDQNERARSIDEFYEEASLLDTKPSAINYWFIMIAMGIAHSGDSAEILSMNFLLANPDFTGEILKGDYAKRGSILASGLFAGMLVGGFLTGAFGDQLGRRPILLSGLTLNFIGGFASALSPNFLFMCSFRFISGLGVGAILSSLITLVTESSPPSKRGRNVGFVASFFTFGSVYVAVLALFLFGRNHVSWRIFLALCALPVFFGNIMIYRWVPESARYLALNNCPEKACASANVIANSMGFYGTPLDIEEVKHHHGRISSAGMDHVRERISATKTLKRTVKKICSLYSRNLRCTTITIQLLGISLYIGSSVNIWINVVLRKIGVANLYMDALYFSLATIPGNIVAALLMDRTGRKPMLVCSMFLCSLSLFYFARAVEHDDAANGGHSAIIGACFYHAFLVIAFCTFGVISSELFPTEVRSTSQGVVAATGRLASMCAQYINGSLVDRPRDLLLVSSFAILFGGCCLFFLRDISNQPLADTIMENDNEIETQQPLINDMDHESHDKEQELV